MYYLHTIAFSGDNITVAHQVVLMVLTPLSACKLPGLPQQGADESGWHCFTAIPYYCTQL
jgi:hypothetical protein